VLRLAGPNAAGALLFGSVYAAAGARMLTQIAFVAALVAAFGLVTALWVHVERRAQGLGWLARTGRATVSLAVVLVGVPVAVLLPLFGLEATLPPEAVAALPLAPVMFLVLVSLGLVVLVNVVGAAAALALGLAARRRRGAAG
jgi:hypothetical protein